jgi:release factor glutamine methyltransferase
LVAKNKGLADIIHIIEDAKSFMHPDSWLMIEHGYDQSQAVRGLFDTAGYKNVETHQDLAGNDRVTIGYFE